MEGKTSVVVVIWRGDRRWRHHLRRQLKMFDAAPPSWELLLIGNGVELPDAAHCFPENVGVAKAWNWGLAAAKGEFTCLLNQDASSSLTELEKLSAYLGRNPDVLAAGPVGSTWDFATMSSLAVQHPSVAQDTDVVSGFCFTVRTQALLEAGGIDPALSPFSYEEVDIALTARRLGMRVVALPDVAVKHSFGISAARPRRRVKWEGATVRVGEVSTRNREYMIRKFRALAHEG